MEIVHINECNISDDIIKYKFKEWIEFHKNNKIIDINDFQDYLQNSYKYYNCIEDIYAEHLIEFLHVIIYNKQLIGIALVEDVSSFDTKIIDITDLILSNNCDWYNIIYNIIIFYEKYKHLHINDNTEYEEYTYDNININFSKIMAHHPILNNIMNSFNSIFLKKYYDNYDVYLIRYKNYNCKYNNNLQINIIGYNGYDKKDIIFNHISNINIIFILKNKQIHYDKFNKPLKYIRKQYQIIFESPIIIDKTIYNNDIYVDISIIYNNKNIKILVNNPSDLRLNKLLIDKISGHNYNIIHSIYCKYDNYEKDANIQSNLSNYNLYSCIQKNITTLLKKCEYKRIIINKPFEELTLLELNILNLDVLFNNSKTDLQKNSHHVEYNYIYLIQKYDVNIKKDLYKFGKTNRHFYKRIKEHGMESKILFILDVDDCNIVESNILNILRNDDNIIERRDIGSEYFYCNNKQYIINLILHNIHL